MGSSFGTTNVNKVGNSNLPESISYIWEEYISDSKNNSLLSDIINHYISKMNQIAKPIANSSLLVIIFEI